MGLSLQRQAFCEYLLQQKLANPTEAARRAGYSAKTARQQASRLLTSADIQAYIQARLTELKMGADEVLLGLAEIARGSMEAFVKVDEQGQLHADWKRAQEENRLHLLKKVKIKSETHLIDDKPVTYTTTEFEIYDRESALTTLARHHKLLTDRVVTMTVDEEAVESIRKGEVDYEDVVELFGVQHANDLFSRAGVGIPGEAGAGETTD